MVHLEVRGTRTILPLPWKLERGCPDNTTHDGTTSTHYQLSCHITQLSVATMMRCNGCTRTYWLQCAVVCVLTTPCQSIHVYTELRGRPADAAAAAAAVQLQGSHTSQEHRGGDRDRAFFTLVYRFMRWTAEHRPPCPCQQPCPCPESAVLRATGRPPKVADGEGAEVLPHTSDNVTARSARPLLRGRGCPAECRGEAASQASRLSSA